MAINLTPSQRRLVAAGLATETDFAEATAAPALTSSQQKLVNAGLASAEDFVAPTESQVTEKQADTQYRQQRKANDVKAIDDFLTEREQYDAYLAFEKENEPGLLSQLVDSIRGGTADRLADAEETGWDPFASQRIDPATGRVETDIARARRDVVNAEYIRSQAPEQSLGDQEAINRFSALADSGSIVDSIKVLADRPTALLNIAARSAAYDPASIAAAAVPGGRIAKGLTGFATGSNAASDSYISEQLSKDSGGDPVKRATLLADKEYMADVESRAAKYGSAIGAVSGASSALAGSFTRNAVSTPSLARRTAAEFTGQTAAEGIGEAAGRLAAGDDVKASDVILEMAAGLPVNTVDTAVGFNQGRKSLEQKLADQAKLDAANVAAKEGTETAARLTEAFNSGVDRSAAPEQLDMFSDPATAGGPLTQEERNAQGAELDLQERQRLLGLNYGGGAPTDSVERATELQTRADAVNPEARARQVAAAEQGIRDIIAEAGGAGISPERQARIDSLRAVITANTDYAAPKTVEQVEAELVQRNEANAADRASKVPPPAPPINPEDLIKVDQLDVANETFPDTRVDRATAVVEDRLQTLDEAASVVDTNQPMRRQREESKANVAEINQLRTFIKTKQDENRPLTRDERRKVRQSIERLGFLEQQEAGRKALVEAKDLRQRAGATSDAGLLQVASELDPSQQFSGLDGPDLSRLTTPQTLSSAPKRKSANNAKGPEVATPTASQPPLEIPQQQELDLFSNSTQQEVVEGIAAARAQEAKQEKATQREQETAVLTGRAERTEFVKSYSSANPTATEQEVMQALDTWQNARITLDSLRTPQNRQAALEAKAAEAVDAAAKKEQTATKAEKTKTDNKIMADAIKNGITDPKQIAQLVLANEQQQQKPQSTATATPARTPTTTQAELAANADQETLSLDPEAFLAEQNARRGTPAPTKPGDRAAMTGDPELDALLAGMEQNEADVDAKQAQRDAVVADETGANDLLRKANTDAGPRGVFTKLADMATKTGDKPVSVIARRLAPLLEAIGTVVEFADKSIQTANGKAAGMFIAGENKIQVAPETKSDRDRVEILAHEGLHAVMVAAYRNADQFNGGVEAKELLDAAATRLAKARESGELQKAIDNVKDPKARERAATILADADGLIFRADGTIEMDELITYANTSRPVQLVLEQIKMRPTTKRSVWSTIVDAAKALLGRDIDNTVLARVMQGTDDLLTAVEQDVDTLNTVVKKEQQAAVDDASIDRAALAPSTNAVPVAEQLMNTSAQGSAPSTNRVVRAVADGVTALRSARVGNIEVGKMVVGAFVRDASRLSASEREALSSASSKTQAVIVQLMADVRTLLGEIKSLKRGTLSGQPAVNEFSNDFAELRDARQAVRDAKTTEKMAEAQAAVDKKYASMKAIWPENIINRLERFQAQIDEQSMLAIEEIILASPVGKDGKRVISQKNIKEINAIKANLGMYVSRSFAVFDNNVKASWKKEMTGEGKTPRAKSIKAQAANLLRTSLLAIPQDRADINKLGIDRLRDLASIWHKDMPTATREELVDTLLVVRSDPSIYNATNLENVVQKEIEAILDGNQSSPTIRQYKSMSVDDSILKERKFLPKELAALMGETQDIGAQLMTTIHKQRTLVEMMGAFRQIAEELSGRAVFDNLASAPPGFVKLDGNYGALSGKYVSQALVDTVGRMQSMQQDFTQAFSDPNQAANIAMNVLGSMSFFAKVPLLLLNGYAWGMNMYGSIMLPVATGNLNSFKSIPKSVTVALGELPGVWLRKNIGDDALNIIKLGLEDSAFAAEITQESLRLAVESFRPPSGWVEKFYRSTAAGPMMGLRLGFDVYAGMDLWSKLSVFYGELATLRKMNTTLPANQRMTEEQLQRTATEWTKEVTPSYERAIPLANMIERAGIGFFVRYNAEVVRNVGNNFARVGKELILAKSLRDQGYTEAGNIMATRAASRATGATAHAFAYKYIAGAFGAGMVAMFTSMFDLEPVDDEDEEKAALAAIVEDRPWMRGKILQVAGKDAQGNYMIVDGGRALPQGPMPELMLGALDVIKGEKDAMDFFGQVKNTFVSASPPVSILLNLENKRERTPKLLREEGAVKDFFDENQISKDGGLADAVRLLEMYMPRQATSALTTAEEGLSQEAFGYAPTVYDPVKGLTSFGLNDEVMETRKVLRDALLNSTVRADDNELQLIAAKAVAADLARFRTMSSRLELARNNGIEDEEILNILRGRSGQSGGSRLTLREAEALLEGNFTESTLSDKTLESILLAIPEEERGDAEDQLYKLTDYVNELTMQVNRGTYENER